MPEALLTQSRVIEILGWARLLRLQRNGWLKPVRRTPHTVLFSPADIRACWRRLERGEKLPPDRIESARTNRNYVPKERIRPQPPGIEEIELDFSTLNLESPV
jgi:hypothetical protein